MTLSELEDNWKTYSYLTASEGCITIKPRKTVNIKALIQWVKDRTYQDKDPYTFPLSVMGWNDIIERYNTHKHWKYDASNMAKNYTPKSFKEIGEWIDWKATLINFLKYQPGRNVVPLSYVIRNKITPTIGGNLNFLDDSINIALTTGRFLPSMRLRYTHISFV